MRAHEVPTHVQAEDKVLLWFTFPQIVAMIAVCAISYGAYSILPFGTAEVRMGLAVVLGLVGIAVTVGKIGGRRLPLVAADLLRYGLGPRRYAGTPADLGRSEPPPPMEKTPGPLSLMVKRAKRGLSRQRRSKSKDRRNGRRPFRPHGWFGKRRKGKDPERDNLSADKAGNHKTTIQQSRQPRQGKTHRAALMVVAVLAMTIAIPQAALADGHWPQGGFEEFEYAPPDPVPGRRLFVEGLEVSGDRAEVTLRAATDLSLRTRAYGGWRGRQLRFWGAASLDEGEAIVYDLPLSGENPSFTFSWEDTLGQAGAVTLKGEQLPHPLPSVAGELCDLRVASLGWTPGSIEGVVASDCVSSVEEEIDLQTAAGHHSDTQRAVMDAAVTAIAGSVSVSAGGSTASATFVPNGDTPFSIPVATGQAVHSLTIGADLTASLEVARPPLVQLTHHPERVEEIVRTVSVVRPGASDSVSETVTLTCADGTTEEHVISASVSIPSEVFYEDVTLTIVHPEHVTAEVVDRDPLSRSRGDSSGMALSIGSDAPYEALTIPEPEPEPEPAEQTPLTEEETQDIFDRLGWWWPW